MMEGQCSQLAPETLLHPPSSTQTITKSWGQQGGHLSVVTPKLGPISTTGSMNLLKATETTDKTHMSAQRSTHLFKA